MGKKMDRKLIAATQPYEVNYFKRKHGLLLEEAKQIIKNFGPSRKACNEAAVRYYKGKISK